MTEEMLRSAVQNRDQFLSVASHELKTPLTTLFMQVQLIQRTGLHETDQSLAKARIGRFVSQVERQTQRLIKLVDDMLDVSRITSGKLSIRREPFSFDAMVGEVVERQKPLLAEFGVEVHLDLEQGLHGAWDRFRMEQVVLNLLSNGLRYGNGSPLRVRLRKPDESSLELRIEDRGPGIPPEDRERVFERFERGTSTQKVSTGLGLGLFICRQIVELHGGQIWVDGSPEGGACFVVALP